MFFYTYIIEDEWTREIVGWAIHTAESEENTWQLFLQIKRRKNLKGVYIHSDNGNPIKASSFSVCLISPGMILSYSRLLRKSDNFFSELLFGTLKRSAVFHRAFASIEAARHWRTSLAVWYNNTHRH